MAIALNTNPSTTKIKNGAIFVRYVAGADITDAQVLAIDSNGEAVPANATAATPVLIGVAKKDTPAGDNVDVVVFGRITSITGGTAGSIAYASETDGEVLEAAPANAAVLGRVENDTTLFVNITQ